MDKLATFRVKPEQWKAFQTLCKDNRTNASAVLIQHIQDCLDSQAIGKASELAPSSSVARSEFNGLRDELGALRDELQLAIRSGLTIAAPISPIAAVTIGSPAIITESLAPIALQPSNEVENNPTITRAKDETQSQPELQPIGIDQDATTPNFLGTGESFRRIAARGYGKSIRTFRSDLAKAAQVRQLPDDLIKLGVRADWNQRESKPSHSNSNRWLWIAPLA